MNVKYGLTGDALTPAVVTVGEHKTPVWLQKRWKGCVSIRQYPLQK